MTDASTAQAPLLEVRDLRVTIGEPPVEAVRGMDFNLKEGEVLGLAGESGSGKSVTALALTRLLPASANPQLSGTVRMKGTGDNLLQLGESALRRIRGSAIAYVFQEPSSSFNPVFTIGSHLEEILKLSGTPARERKTAIEQSLEEVGIEPTASNLEAYPGAFSGGMLQRLAIACALVAQPSILVADEPTTALDTSTQQRIMELLARLNERHGMAILFISHNLGLLNSVAGRLLVMQRGNLVEEGPVGDVLRNPGHPYTRELVRSIPRLR
jgi:ABC-type dipeptide/oligopeptide/nickel transport system ATPase component